jgi:AraC-like DNA-binding protein
MRIPAQTPNEPTSLLRLPAPALRPFIQYVWVSAAPTKSDTARHLRERMLPSGGMNLVFRLSDHPIRMFSSLDDRVGDTHGFSVVGGMRTRYYIKDSSQPVRTVGAALQPGVSLALFGAHADELADRHTSLIDLWGNSATAMRERLLEQGQLASQLNLFEQMLMERLPRLSGLHPAIAHALQRFNVVDDIAGIVRETGYSHRHFIALFRRSVGVTPALYHRTQRFKQVMQIIAGSPGTSWAEVALQAGYADQPHFNREFREFAGIAPGAYNASGAQSTLHVPIP